jgi:hypothetical protein
MSALNYWDTRHKSKGRVQIPPSELKELEWRAIGSLLEQFEETVDEATDPILLRRFIDDMSATGDTYGPIVVKACLDAAAALYEFEAIEDLGADTNDARKANLFYEMFVDVWNEVAGLGRCSPSTSIDYADIKQEMSDHISTLLTPYIAKRESVHPPSPTDQDSSFVFISYKRDDLLRISPMLESIAGWGHKIWYDRGIPGGVEWDKYIEEKVSRCSALIAFLSPDAVRSKWIRREIKYADYCDKPILAVFLEDTSLGEGLDILLREVQFIDATTSDWSSRLERAMTRLKT